MKEQARVHRRHHAPSSAYSGQDYDLSRVKNVALAPRPEVSTPLA